MFPSIDQILPSLQALGVLGYWLIGLASALEAFFLTGVVVPGTLVVDAGGLLVQQGLMDFFDLCWFVAIGSILGSELSYWTGRLALHRIPGRQKIEGSAVFRRAQALFERRGGLALVMGRFLGPVAGLVPLAAAMSGMERRRFLIWNVIGSVPYALGHVAFGYVMGDAASWLGGSLGHSALVAGIAAAVLAVLWLLLYAALKLLPLALVILGVVTRALAAMPPVARLIAAHPRIARWVEARLDRHQFTGLPLTLLSLIFVYIGVVWLDTVVDFVAGDPVLQIDARLAQWIHTLQSPVPLRVATLLSAIGGKHVVVPLTAALLVWLLLRRQKALAIGLAVSVASSAAAVAALKLVFQRPRSPLGYFAETSNSFPSGHAGSSIGAFGMMFYVLWRAGKIRAETALLGAGLMALSIGGSRIYLIEHYASDVFSGWLVGALALVSAIAISEWLIDRQPAPRGPILGWRNWAGQGLVVALLLLAAFEVSQYAPPRNAPVETLADQQITSVETALSTPGTDLRTLSLLGTEVRPMSIAVLAPDAASIETALSAQGWVVTGLQGPRALIGALNAAVEADADPTVEIAPHFWRGMTPTLTLAAPSDPSAHARFWRTEFVTTDGLRLFLASVGSDATPEPGAPQAVDGSQAELLQALDANGTANAPITLGDVTLTPVTLATR
ncbi:VTT domain-containing protein [Cereibacter sphaeroides]|nr:VTT domain-containing protein [Cereibacter sphaeroides]